MKGVIDLKCTRTTTEAKPTARVTQVSLQFGVPRTALTTGPTDTIRLTLGPARIIALVGPSGSGKSTALARLEDHYPRAHNVGRTTFATGRPLVDAILPTGTLPDTLAILSAAGLGEPRLWIRYYRELSEGEKFRARLAKTLGLVRSGDAGAPLICDEFCTGLHRRAAKAIAFNLRKLVTRRNLCLIVATPDDDLLTDLQPDTLVRLDEHGRVEVTSHAPVSRPISLRRRLCIERGCKRDYDIFAPMHYRATAELGFVDKVFVMRQGSGGKPLGIVVYSHGPLELALRNQATQKRYCRNSGRLNREVRILRRLVIHPDLRGCGLGHYLVRKTLPLVGTKYVECLASMGTINPVFERAGMKRIGQCERPAEQVRALRKLEELDIDPAAADFPAQVCRRPRVRRLVAQFVYNWYRATTGRGERRVARQSPQFLAQTFRGLAGSQPIYYLWSRSDAK